jgi:hypothetical protein
VWTRRNTHRPLRSAQGGGVPVDARVGTDRPTDARAGTDRPTDARAETTQLSLWSCARKTMGFHPLDLLRLIPVCPTSWGVHKLQAPMLYRVRPGQWVQKLCGIRTNWHREQWRIKGSAAEVMSALMKCEELTEQPCRSELPQFRRADFQIHKVTERKFVCFFYTHRRQWLDCCEIDLDHVPGGGKDELAATAFSFSAAVVPAASPAAILPSVLLFFIPFGDMVRKGGLERLAYWPRLRSRNRNSCDRGASRSYPAGGTRARTSCTCEPCGICSRPRASRWNETGRHAMPNSRG